MKARDLNSILWVVPLQGPDAGAGQGVGSAQGGAGEEGALAPPCAHTRAVANIAASLAKGAFTRAGCLRLASLRKAAGSWAAGKAFPAPSELRAGVEAPGSLAQFRTQTLGHQPIQHLAV